MNELPFTLHQLQVFTTIAQVGTVTGAAAHLHVTQPAVSVALGELERRLGLQLFERVKRRLVLTTEGEIFLGKAAEILELSREAMVGLGQPHAGGVLRLGASTTIGNYVLPGSLCTFSARFPAVHVRLTVDISDIIVDKLIEGAFPLAFIEGPCSRAGVHVERFRPDELVLVLPPRHPWHGRVDVDWKDVCRERLIVRSQGGTRDVIRQVVEREGYGLDPALEFGHTEAIKTAVGLGLGVSILSRIACAREIAAGVLGEARVHGLRFHRWLYRLTLEGRRMGQLTAAFWEYLNRGEQPGFGSLAPNASDSDAWFSPGPDLGSPKLSRLDQGRGDEQA